MPPVYEGPEAGAASGAAASGMGDSFVCWEADASPGAASGGSGVADAACYTADESSTEHPSEMNEDATKGSEGVVITHC